MTEQEREVIKRLLDKSVDINRKASDVIICEHDTLRKKNYMTGKESNNINDVIRDNKFVMLGNPFLSKPIGYYAVIDRKEDAIIVILAYFSPEKSKWEETCRYVFLKNGAHMKKINEDRYDPTRLDFFTYRDETFVDITGSCCIEDNFYAWGTQNVHNIAGDSTKAMREFTNGGIKIRSELFLEDFEKGGASAFCVEMIEYGSTDLHGVTFGIYERNMEGIAFEKKPFPEEARQFLREKATKAINDSLSSTGNPTNMFIGGRKNYHFGYLQRCSDGNYVYRLFSAVIKDRAGKDGLFPLKYIEHYRCGINPDSLADMNLLKKPLLYYDKDVKGGPFEYLTKYLDEAIESTKNELFTSYMTSTDAYLDASRMVVIPFVMYAYPAVEKILSWTKKADSEHLSVYDNLTDDILSNLKFTTFEPNIPQFGPLDFSQKEVHKILGIPKLMLNAYNGNSSAWAIHVRLLKFIFEDDKQYFLNINSDDLMQLRQKLGAMAVNSTSDQKVQIARNYVTAYGGKGLLNFMNFVENLDSEELTTYKHYMEKIVVVKQFVPTIEWKLKGEALERADESITMAYNIMKDKELYAETTEKFKTHFKEWEQYTFNDGKFIIMYPTGPSDLVEEGIKLKHCVKEFIDKVADGETTILFIRTMKNPLKPFFTMEIMDGSIRQVHGVSNENHDSVDGLEEFLIEFANDKRLSLDIDGITELLGPVGD